MYCSNLVKVGMNGEASARKEAAAARDAAEAFAPLVVFVTCAAVVESGHRNGQVEGSSGLGTFDLGFKLPASGNCYYFTRGARVCRALVLGCCWGLHFRLGRVQGHETIN